MPDEPKIISFGKELDPDVEAKYQEKIARARASGSPNALKGKDVLGFEPRPSMPIIKNERKNDGYSELRDVASGVAGVQPRPPGSPVLSPETVRQLQDAAEEVLQKKEKAEQKAEEDDFDVMDLLSSQDPIAKILDNKQRRKDIESRCLPMNFEDLLYKDEVRQLVPIKPGDFEVLFRSINPEENLFIKKLVADEKAVSDSYIAEYYTLCQLAAGVVSINGREFPDHRDENGSPSIDLFKKKLAMFKRKSGYIVTDLMINYRWFDIRVRKLIQPDDLKNG